MDPTALQTHIKNNTLDQAELELEQARRSAADTERAAEAARASNDLGVVSLLQNRYDQARAEFVRAQQEFIMLDDVAGQGRAVGNLAQLEERAGDRDKASALYLQAADLLHEGGALADEYTTRRRLSRYYLSRGAGWMALSESAKALAVKPNATRFDRVQRWLYALPLRLMGLG